MVDSSIQSAYENKQIYSFFFPGKPLGSWLWTKSIVGKKWNYKERNNTLRVSLEAHVYIYIYIWISKFRLKKQESWSMNVRTSWWTPTIVVIEAVWAWYVHHLCSWCFGGSGTNFGSCSPPYFLQTRSTNPTAWLLLFPVHTAPSSFRCLDLLN